MGTPLPLHNKYIYKTTKDSLKLMIMGVLGGRIESHLVYQLDPRNATPGNLASDMTIDYSVDHQFLYEGFNLIVHSTVVFRLEGINNNFYSTSVLLVI